MNLLWKKKKTHLYRIYANVSLRFREKEREKERQRKRKKVIRLPILRMLTLHLAHAISQTVRESYSTPTYM